MARMFRGEDEDENQPRQTAATRKFGLEVAAVTRDLADKFGYKTLPKSGVVITRVEPGSDAAEQGLAAGMVIARVQDKAIKTAEEFTKMLSAKESASGVRLLVTDRNGGQRFVFITPAREGK
jgi:serine protease Do